MIVEVLSQSSKQLLVIHSGCPSTSRRAYPQAKGRALGQARAARPRGLRQRLGGQRLERVLAWRPGGAQRTQDYLLCG